MANKYITALLIILAATGVEAQTYQSALKLALTDISYQEFILQPEAKALEDDILSVIRAFKEVDENKDDLVFPYCLSEFSYTDKITFDLSNSCDYSNLLDIHLPDVIRNSIVIRGPDC